MVNVGYVARETRIVQSLNKTYAQGNEDEDTNYS